MVIGGERSSDDISQIVKQSQMLNEGSSAEATVIVAKDSVPRKLEEETHLESF